MSWKQSCSSGARRLASCPWSWEALSQHAGYMCTAHLQKRWRWQSPRNILLIPTTPPLRGATRPLLSLILGLLSCRYSSCFSVCLWLCKSFSFHSVHSFFFFNSYFIYLFIYLYLFLAVLGLRFVRGLSLVAASGGHSSSRCAGLSLSRPLPLRGTGSRRAGSVVVAHGPSCSAACGIFPDQGSNPCPLHWRADS